MTTRRTVAAMLAIAAIGAPNGCRDFLALNCRGGGVVPPAEVQDVRELRDRWRRCGECSAGETCNVLPTEPHCTPSPGVEGVACGLWKSRNLTREIAYACADTLRCNTAYSPPQCMPPAGLRESCARDDDCNDGLVCAVDSPRRCRPAIGAGEPCDHASCAKGLTCDRSKSPPVCIEAPSP